MLKGTLTPPAMKPVRLWAGLYGGHYDMIVFYREKPTRSDEDDDRLVDTYAEHKAGNVFADMATGTFEAWFPELYQQLIELRLVNPDNAGRPWDTEVRWTELFEVELTIPLDEDGEWEGLTVHDDW